MVKTPTYFLTESNYEELLGFFVDSSAPFGQVVVTPVPTANAFACNIGISFGNWYLTLVMLIMKMFMWRQWHHLYDNMQIFNSNGKSLLLLTNKINSALTGKNHQKNDSVINSWKFLLVMLKDRKWNTCKPSQIYFYCCFFVCLFVSSNKIFDVLFVFVLR